MMGRFGGVDFLSAIMSPCWVFYFDGWWEPKMTFSNCNHRVKSSRSEHWSGYVCLVRTRSQPLVLTGTSSRIRWPSKKNGWIKLKANCSLLFSHCNLVLLCEEYSELATNSLEIISEHQPGWEYIFDIGWNKQALDQTFNTARSRFCA